MKSFLKKIATVTISATILVSCTNGVNLPVTPNTAEIQHRPVISLDKQETDLQSVENLAPQIESSEGSFSTQAAMAWCLNPFGGWQSCTTIGVGAVKTALWVGGAAVAGAGYLYHQATKSGSEYKERDTSKKGKEASSDVPSWVVHDPKARPKKGESGKDFADRVMRERYGDSWRNRGTGPNSEHNKIRKYGDRAFK